MSEQMPLDLERLIAELRAGAALISGDDYGDSSPKEHARRRASASVLMQSAAHALHRLRRAEAALAEVRAAFVVLDARGDASPWQALNQIRATLARAEKEEGCP